MGISKQASATARNRTALDHSYQAFRSGLSEGQRGMSNDASDNGPYFPYEVAELYNFPAGTGAGQSIAILEASNTGYSIDALNDYFLNTLQLPQAPILNAIQVGNGVFNPHTNSP